MNSTGYDLIRQREAILIDGMSDVTADLLKIEPSAYVAFLEYRLMPEIYLLVEEILKKRLPSKDLQFSCTGEAAIRWRGPATIGLDFELTTNDAEVFFRLYLSPGAPSISLHHISFANGSDNPQENNARLKHAFR